MVPVFPHLAWYGLADPAGMVETCRDLLSGVLGIDLSTAANRTSRVMKVPAKLQASIFFNAHSTCFSGPFHCKEFSSFDA